MMLIRFFVYSSNENGAKMVVNELFQDEIIKRMHLVDEIVLKKIESYWKIDNMYEIEVDVNLKRKITEVERDKFLGTISSTWKFYGNPIDEALTSETMEDINYLRKDIAMVDIFFSSDYETI